MPPDSCLLTRPPPDLWLLQGRTVPTAQDAVGLRTTTRLASKTTRFASEQLGSKHLRRTRLASLRATRVLVTLRSPKAIVTASTDLPRDQTASSCLHLTHKRVRQGSPVCERKCFCIRLHEVQSDAVSVDSSFNSPPPVSSNAIVSCAATAK